MSKIKQRRAMKSLAISSHVVSECDRAYKVGGIGMMHILIECDRKTKAMAETPAELFRADRPKLDIRRWRKHKRKQGGCIVYGKPPLADLHKTLMEIADAESK